VSAQMGVMTETQDSPLLRKPQWPAAATRMCSRDHLPSPCQLTGKMQQHYSGPVSQYILCISTASGK
jgi:hypothetical protein